MGEIGDQLFPRLGDAPTLNNCHPWLMRKLAHLATATGVCVLGLPALAQDLNNWTTVTPQWLYEGNYLVQRATVINGVTYHRSAILDCPTGTVSFWNPIENRVLTRPVNSKTSDLERICIRRWGYPGAGK